MWTCCENETGVVEAVASMASRSLRRERRRVESSVEGGGMCCFACFPFDDNDAEADWGDSGGLMEVLGGVERRGAEAGLMGRNAGGFLVASAEALTGREANAASRSLA